MSESRHDLDRTRARRGLLLIALITLSALVVFFLDVAIRATAEGERITVLAPAAPGLAPGASVWVAGRPVGRVLSIEFRPPGSEGGSVLIRAVLERGVERYLRADATAEVRPSDLLEPVIVAIEPGSDAAPFDSASPLLATEQGAEQDAVLALADTLLQAGRRLADQATTTRDLLESGRGSLQRLRRDRTALLELRESLSRLQGLLVEDFPESTVARLASDTILGPAAERLDARLRSLADSPGRAGAERAAEAMSDALAGLEARVTELAGRLDRGEGTAGRALVDGELARQIELLRATLRKLTDELVRYPGRWFRVRIF